MKPVPSFEEFKHHAAQGNVIPVSVVLMADVLTPVGVYAQLRDDFPAFLFESVTGGEHIGRYSYIGFDPHEVITASRTAEGLPEVSCTLRGGSRTVHSGVADPLEFLRKRMASMKAVTVPGLPPFTGGAVGYLGHEYVHCAEASVPLNTGKTQGLPFLSFALTDTVIAFDNARQLVYLITNAHLGEGVSESGLRAAYDACLQRLEAVRIRLEERHELSPAAFDPVQKPVVVPPGNFSRESFKQAVRVAQSYIAAGDIIQVVLSQQFEHPLKARPIDLYRSLRVVNPSPYMFILETDDFSIVGASPEVHVRCSEGKVEIRPIAGTRPRGRSEAEDVELEKELLADPKERAEHLMLVDLARNDIGRVCSPGTVAVRDYAVIERYSHVMHIVSQVEGQLSPSHDAFDLMRATFPAGTLTGAPKIRAMQIIAELEPQQRGIYGGALGYFGYNGSVNTAITIRTAIIQNGNAYIQAGAGIVADSVPESEYEETVNKARGMLAALVRAESLS